MSWSEDDSTQLPAVQEQYVRERVGYLLEPLTSAGINQETVDWIADDLYNVYAEGLADGTSAQLEQDVYGRAEWIAGQLTTERRLAVFQQILMYVGQGDVWSWMQRWEGLDPSQVGEDPNVANAWAPGGVFDPAPPAQTAESSSLGAASYSTYGEDAPTPEVSYQQYGAEQPAETVYEQYPGDN